MMQAQADAGKLHAYIRAFMTHGHMFANLDPLKLDEVYDAGIADKFMGSKHAVKDLLNV